MSGSEEERIGIYVAYIYIYIYSVCELKRECCLVLVAPLFAAPRSVEQLGSEVVVGALCGSAVLRGAHVFAPGIVATPKCETSTTQSVALRFLSLPVCTVCFLFQGEPCETWERVVLTPDGVPLMCPQS